MKEFIFVSDFDGTMTAKDFYHIIMDNYLGKWGRELYDSWKRGEMYDVEFLSAVFKAINRSQEEIDQDILRIEMDEDTADFIEQIKLAGGDFVILSAGAKYYIERCLAFHHITNLQIIANGGIYENKGITLIPPERQNAFYSERYGIDKGLVVQDLKKKYQKVYYAGDSGPDLNAALLADVAFAKKELIPLLGAKGIKYIPFTSFKQIAAYLQKNGVIA
ncbi:MAG: MtnX-like HAD-IB family phosphatase [Pelosinus sp.]|nr:MtnX-like HAD-IB family phosphatase [Pelosinus sp.]